MFQRQNFKNVLSITALFSILGLLLFLAGIGSCRKELELDSTAVRNTAVLDRGKENNPAVTHGMLHFDSHEKFNIFVKSLEVEEADTTRLRNAFIALGVDVTAEFSPNLTDNPVCLLREKQIDGFVSARKVEENIINAALNSGSDEINSIVVFPYWKTALNSNNAVHIGNRIYKYYDNGGMAIILNNDWALYESIQNSTFEDLREAYNLIITSDAQNDWEDYFVLNDDKSIKEDKAIIKLRTISMVTATGDYQIINTSLLESANPATSFKWVYGDDSVSYGINPVGIISSTEDVKLVAENSKGEKDSLNKENLFICSITSFSITNLANNQFRFELPGFNPANPNNSYKIRWAFSDGTTISDRNPVTKTFSANGTVTCQFLYKNSDEIACQLTKPYLVKCGDKKSKSEEMVFTIKECNPDQKWKLDGSIWVQTGEVGCKVKCHRKIAGVWFIAKTESICADISGTYIREGSATSQGKNCNTITAAGSKCKDAGIIPNFVAFTIPEIPNVFTDPGKLSAGLTIDQCGVTKGWGASGASRLIL